MSEERTVSLRLHASLPAFYLALNWASEGVVLVQILGTMYLLTISRKCCFVIKG